MADEKKKKKEKTSFALPSAWKSLKHRNETADARTTYEDAWKAVGILLAILFLAFVMLGGVSQTGMLKFIFKWSHNVGMTVSSWIEGGSIITNEDGIYIDPTGKKGTKIDNTEKIDAVDVANKVDEIQDELINEDSSLTNSTTDNSNVDDTNNEVSTE